MADLRYKNVGYVALNVSDRSRSTAFQRETIGLETNPNVDPQTFGATLLRCGPSACDVALYDGPEPGLRRIAFEMESERYFDAALKHLIALGVKTWDVPARDRTAFAQRSSFRFAEPNTDLTVELFVANEGEIPALAVDRSYSNLDRLGHVVITTVDPPAVTKFFADEMNFRVSDYIENVAFMRCFPNPFHHSLAIVPGNENRLNHVNFLVHTMDDFGQAMNRAKRQKVDIVFGPGRHPPSGASSCISSTRISSRSNSAREWKNFRRPAIANRGTCRSLRNRLTTGVVPEIRGTVPSAASFLRSRPDDCKEVSEPHASPRDDAARGRPAGCRVAGRCSDGSNPRAHGCDGDRRIR